MRIDPDSRGVQGVTGFLEFVALNVVFIIACLPVVTIGVATSSLFEVTMRYSDDERGKPLPDFFRALRRNFAPATLVYLAFAIPGAMLAFSGFFWLSQGSIVSGIAGVLAFVAAAYCVAAFILGMGLVARYRQTVRQTLRNALLLPGAEPVRTFALVLIPVTAAALVVVFRPFWIILITVGFSTAAYGAAFLFRSMFSRQA
ncbi:YesL family protein [Demequina pelophila]|uniref:YesL family protein n=1 Tax=Demequina pelophila TaxID=1638984 RepID=UPI00078209A1|nr:YesL family protein [Demequina pelophila]